MTKRGYVAVGVMVVVAVAVVLFLLLRSPSGIDVPTKRAEVIIALDAGHGGRDPGATAGDVLEKDINLAIVKKAQALIDADPDLKAHLTRSVDVFLALEERVRLAQEANAALYITVHANSFGDPQVHGIETWVDTTRKDGDPAYVFASMIQDSLSAATGARNRGIRTQESYLQRCGIPAVSLEVGYMTNPDERARLLDPLYQDKVAAGILGGVKQFLAWQAAGAAAATGSTADTSPRKP
ncbi:MAG: N-acetylmuramoyl-L-alanine amidase [Candidatus Bipolaricaulota bacterium]